MHKGIGSLPGVRGECLGAYSGLKSEVIYHKKHLLKVSFMVLWYLKTIYYFRGPPSLKG